MSVSAPFSIRQLTSGDVALMNALLTSFGEAFDEVETYSAARPSRAYLKRLLGSECFITLAALKKGSVVGDVTAYELRKFEQERSEIYIYDLAVAAAHRRDGIATALIQELRTIAVARGAYAIFVQADRGTNLPSGSTRSWGSAKTCCISTSPSRAAVALFGRGLLVTARAYRYSRIGATAFHARRAQQPRK